MMDVKTDPIMITGHAGSTNISGMLNPSGAENDTSVTNIIAVNSQATNDDPAYGMENQRWRTIIKYIKCLTAKLYFYI